MPQLNFDIGEEFNSAQSHQEIQELEFKIEELTQEIESLKNQGDALSEEKIKELRSLLESGGIQKIRLDEIAPNPNQPRKTFSNESIQNIARSLQEEGQQEPIILIEQKPYLLFDGERRWRAATLLNWESLNAVLIKETSPEKLHRRVLVASLHREGLNNLDVAEALIQEIQFKTGLSEPEIIASVRTGVQKIRRKGKKDEMVQLITEPTEVQLSKLEELGLADPEQKSLGVLFGLQLNPGSVSSRTFQMLQLPEDLKVAIRSKGLSVAHALEVSRLNSKTLNLSEPESEIQRIACVEQVIREKLSVQKTKQLVSSLLPSKPKKNGTGATVKAIKDIDVNKLEKEERDSLKQALKQLLQELEEDQ